MQVFYLIDFENVGVNGLRGIETVGGTDSIHLFSTNKGTKLDVKTLSRLNGKSITYHNVPQRKQSVDMHLVSYLFSKSFITTEAQKMPNAAGK